MGSVFVACLAVGTPLFALGMSSLQTSLERWDYQKHAQD